MKEKDILCICKGKYDTQKHKTIIDALKAYQSKICKIEPDYISHKDILDFGLYPVAEKFFDKEHWVTLLKDKMESDIRMTNYSKLSKEKIITHLYLCEILIFQLNLLPVRDKQGNWIIDLSDYSDIKYIV